MPNPNPSHCGLTPDDRRVEADGFGTKLREDTYWSQEWIGFRSFRHHQVCWLPVVWSCFGSLVPNVLNRQFTVAGGHHLMWSQNERYNKLPEDQIRMEYPTCHIQRLMKDQQPSLEILNFNSGEQILVRVLETQFSVPKRILSTTVRELNETIVRFIEVSGLCQVLGHVPVFQGYFRNSQLDRGARIQKENGSGLTRKARCSLLCSRSHILEHLNIRVCGRKAEL